jgi:hypothetical protein
MNTFCRILAAAGLVGIALAVASGCGSKKDSRPRRVPVSGTVLRMGQPVAAATVLFEPLGSTPAATGETDAAGQFRLTTFDPGDGAVPGEYAVAVRKVEVIPSNRPGDAPDDLATPPPDEKWLLPVKYGHTTSSGLTATVKADATNDFKFELPE